MPTATWTPLANLTLGSSASSVTFSNIPNTYRDLILIVAGSSTATATFGVQFNGDTANNYTYVEMNGDGSTYESSSSTLSQALIGRFTTTVAVAIGQIMDYSATDKHKTVLARGGGAGDIVRASASRWANNNAITSVKVLPLSNSFASGTVMSLYGVIA